MDQECYVVICEWEPYRGAGTVDSVVAVFSDRMRAEEYRKVRQKEVKPRDYSTVYAVCEIPLNPAFQK